MPAMLVQSQHLQESRRTSPVPPFQRKTSTSLPKDISIRRHELIQTQKLSDDKDSPKSRKPSKGSSFFKLFPDIGEMEVVIKTYHCAFIGDILLQGSLYVTQNWFCFYSKLLGRKAIKIAVQSVTDITKKKLAKIIPNALVISTENSRYVFGSLISRDSTYQLLIEIWQHKQGINTGGMISTEEAGIDADPSVALHASLLPAESASSFDDCTFSSDLLACHSDADETSCSGVVVVAALCDARASDDDGDSTSNAAMELLPGNGGVDDGATSRRRRHSVTKYCDSQTGDQTTGTTEKAVFLSTSVKQLAAWVKSLPVTCLFLTISTVLVLFLLFSAFLLTCKLVQLQTQIEIALEEDNEDDAYKRLLDDADLQQSDCVHPSRVDDIYKVLLSHVRLMNQVNQELHALQQLTRVRCLTSDCDTTS